MGKFQLKYKSFTNGQFCYELSNCKGSHELEIKTFDCQLRNEPFDEVRIEKYQCLGHWSSDFPGKYFGIMKSKTQYKCIVSILICFWRFFFPFFRCILFSNFPDYLFFIFLDFSVVCSIFLNFYPIFYFISFSFFFS